jgi:nucleotide-binding universal stress UspA family protein
MTGRKLHYGNLSTLKIRRNKMTKYPKYKKILFCTDFSENSDHAFEFAFGIAKRDEGLLYILHVIPVNPYQKYAEAYTTKENLGKIRKNIEEDVNNQYEEHYVKKIENGTKFRIVTKSGGEAEEIIKFSKHEKVDLIVMGTHGRTGIEHLFLGSVAEKVIQRSPSPVFIIPARKVLERS